jgi:hypothetical protein
MFTSATIAQKTASGQMKNPEIFLKNAAKTPAIIDFSRCLFSSIFKKYYLVNHPSMP